MKNDIYTDSCDYIRTFGGYDKNGVRLSRSDASQIRQSIAKVLNMEDEVLATKISEYYKEHEIEVNERSMRYLLESLHSS